MRVKLYTFWEQLTGSFWFLPTFMVIVAIIMASVTIAVDQTGIKFDAPALSWVYSGSPDGARSVLSTLASSMISVAGLTFSITMVTLSLASSQLGPRLLNNFMRDTGNQIVLGTFISIFIYCLLILRSIRSLDEISFVPHLSLSIAIILAVISLGVLIYFFHHVSTMIQAQNLIAEIGQEMEQNIERLFSSDDSNTPYENELRNDNDIPEDFESNSETVGVPDSGFLQAIDYESLSEVAQENDVLLKFLYRPGDFVTEESDLIAIYPAENLTEDVREGIIDNLAIGNVRLRIQDIEYSIDQLVEIAVRALSPGINDPFTAIACLDQLSATLSELTERTMPSGYHYDADGELRIISNVITFEGVVQAAFNQIRRYGKSDVAVMTRLLEVITIIIARTQTDEQRAILLEQAEMIKTTTEQIVDIEQDKHIILERYNTLMNTNHERDSD